MGGMVTFLAGSNLSNRSKSAPRTKAIRSDSWVLAIACTRPMTQERRSCGRLCTRCWKLWGVTALCPCLRRPTRPGTDHEND